MIRNLAGRARGWLGEGLVGLGLRLLGASTREGYEPPPVPGDDEPDDDPDAVVPAPALSPRAYSMLDDARNARVWGARPEPASPEAAPAGSIADRIAKTRARLGE